MGRKIMEIKWIKWTENWLLKLRCWLLKYCLVQHLSLIASPSHISTFVNNIFHV